LRPSVASSMVKSGSDSSDRPTIRPEFDLEEYARHSEKLMAVAPALGTAGLPQHLPAHRDQLPTLPAFSPDDLAATLPPMREPLATVPALSPIDLAEALPSRPPMPAEPESEPQALALAPCEPPPESRVEPPSGPVDTTFTTSTAFAAEATSRRPSSPVGVSQARVRVDVRARAMGAVAAALIVAIGFAAHRAGSSPPAPSLATRASSVVAVPPEPPQVDVAAAPEPQELSPPFPPREAEPVAAPRVPAPRAPPAKPAASAAPAPRRRSMASDRDAVLNPFE